MKKDTTHCREQFKEIYLNNQRDKIIPFLQQLSKEEKKGLIPLLKKYNREWSDATRAILYVALIACCNHTEIKKEQGNIILRETDPLLSELLEWYCPEWFSTFINETHEQSSLDYRILLDWYHKGYLQPAPPLIAKSLFFNRHRNNIDIEADPIILQEHIWTFFEHETNYIFWENYTDKEGKKIQRWIKILKQYSDNGTIDRMRLLKAILQTANHPFTKESVAWFCDLLETLAPTPAELLTLQEDLLNGLQTDRPRWTRMILAEIARLLPEKNFKAEELLPYLPVLFTKKEKNLLTTALQVAEKINKTYPQLQSTVCTELVAVFLIQDKKLQTKAAKQIVKYGAGAQQQFSQILEEYRNYILLAVQEILKPFLQAAPAKQTARPEVEKEAESLPVISDTNRLPEVNTWEDLIFFATQAFSEKEAYYPIMLPDYIYKFDKEITAEKAKQLRPVYKLEERQGMNDWSYYSFNDGMLKIFLISYARYLNNRFPGAIPSVETQEERKDLSAGRYSMVDGLYFTAPVYDRVAEIMHRIEQQQYYEPVSMPTHYPLWIDPVILVERLQRCQEYNYQPIATELQQAVMRCCLEDTNEAAKKAASLQGEWKHLLLYLLGKEELRKEQMITPALWITAALTRNKGILPELLLDKLYEVPVQLYPGYLHWEIDPHPHPDTKGKGVVFNPKTRFYYKDEPSFPLLYQYYISYRFKSRHNIESGGIYRIITSMPYNHDLFMACVVEYISVGSILFTAQEQWMKHVLRALRDLHLPCTPMDHLAISMSFFNRFKEVVQYAAETWYEGSAAGWIDPTELGKTMGKLIEQEWQPLQRFTNILRDEMLLNRDNTPLLLQLIEATLATLKQPVKGVKALLEAYKELLNRTGQKAPTNKFPQWETWVNENNLKKLIKGLQLLIFDV